VPPLPGRHRRGHARHRGTPLVGNGGAGGPGAAPDAETAARAVFARLSHRLLALLPPSPVRQRGWTGEPVPDLGYIMAAVADEAMLHGPPWPGQTVWSRSLLEDGLYGTSIAGERLFEAADALVAAPGPRAQPTIAVLLVAFSQGFRGRYRGREDGGRIAALIVRLHAALFAGATPSVPSAEAQLAAAPLHLLQEASGRRLPSRRPWVFACLALLAGYLVMSHLLWSSAVAPVRAIATRIN
ncbi:MAG: DotU family type IV/VI secretion system protein, partial [Paracraurococcus sp.]